MVIIGCKSRTYFIIKISLVDLKAINSESYTNEEERL